jgi:glycosyltransferase involved in cell wall biosynthesis
MNDDVTVVVTCFDYGAFLEEAVASALAQEGGAPHVIVVDDGSTDPHTLEVLGRLHADVRVHRQDNAGLAAARNAGVRLSGTPYVLPLDADDRLPPGALRALRPPLERDPRLGFAYGIMEFFGDWGGTLFDTAYDPFRLLYRHQIGASALIRRALFDDVGGWDPEFRGYEDWEFWLHALERGWRGERVRAVTYEYRRHGDTMISGARRDYRSWYRRLRTKHAPLYARSAEFARESGTPLAERLAYRLYWGPRPVPARVEAALYRRLFSRRG